MLKNNLQKARKAKMLTQEDVAKKLNIKRQTYSAYERGVSVPDAHALSELANLFSCTTDYLLGRVDEPNLVHYEIPNAEGMQIAIDIVEDALKEGLTPEDIKKFVALAKEMKNSSNKD